MTEMWQSDLEMWRSDWQRWNPDLRTIISALRPMEYPIYDQVPDLQPSTRFTTYGVPDTWPSTRYTTYGVPDLRPSTRCKRPSTRYIKVCFRSMTYRWACDQRWLTKWLKWLRRWNKPLEPPLHVLFMYLSCFLELVGGRERGKKGEREKGKRD